MRKVAFSALFVVLVLSSAMMSHGQAFGESDLPQIELQLRSLIADSGIKQLLADDINRSGKVRGRLSPIQIALEHTALDVFSDTEVCMTADFSLGPLKGVLSLLFRWEGTDPILVDWSYWFARTEVSEDISEDTTWTPMRSPYYVTRGISIYEGVTLTIAPGTVVRFRKYTDPREQVYLWVSEDGDGGTLHSQGTEATPVKFTSNCDFDDLDKIQGFGWESSDWGGIQTGTNGNIIVEHTIFEYGNWAIDTWEREGQIAVLDSVFRKCTGAVYTWGYNSVTVVNNAISDCGDGAVYAGFREPDAGGDIAGNVITLSPDKNPWRAIQVEGGIPDVSGNSITGYFSQGIRADGLEPSAMITGNTIFSRGDAWRGINASGGACTISGNEILGTYSDCIGVDDFHGMIASNNIDSSLGWAGRGIGVWGGDPTVSGNGIIGSFEWRAIELSWTYGLVSGNIIDETSGETRWCAILIEGGEPTVEANPISGVFDLVIRVEGGSTATIAKHQLKGNYGVYCVDSEPQIHSNNIEGNTEYGVYNETPETHIVYAEENWWGHETGPYHIFLNPGGLGDRISYGVKFVPWLPKPMLGVPTGAVRKRPPVFALGENFPDPFNPDTWIPYQLAEDVAVTISIYNVSGQLVRTLDLGHKPAGFYTTKDEAAHWDARNEAGEQVGSGIYFYTVQAGDFAAVKKMVIAK